MSKNLRIKSGHHTILFEFTPNSLYVYTSCCGARVPHRKAERLHKALTKWLAA